MSRLARPDGCSLYFETHGTRGSEPIVLVEGIGGSVEAWGRTIPLLATELFVVAPDLRGNGRSDMPGESISIETLADDMLAVMDEVGLPSAHVYGLSLGGTVAIRMALAARSRVRTLVLGATHAQGPLPVRPRASGPKGAPHLLLYSPRFAAERPERVAEDLRTWSRTPRRPGAARRQWEALRRFDAYDLLPGITAPTLVLHGTEDRVVDPENARILASRIPRAELLLLEGAGHAFHSERAEEAAAMVLDFVRRHAA
ncbi:MAG TPA: alpha/beta fold hydrolase [Actinomycetota bacterium]|nr:alpha/beta fold hydrolase [Actinomycetota bacterium]